MSNVGHTTNCSQVHYYFSRCESLTFLKILKSRPRNKFGVQNFRIVWDSNYLRRSSLLLIFCKSFKRRKICEYSNHSYFDLVGIWYPWFQDNCARFWEQSSADDFFCYKGLMSLIHRTVKCLNFEIWFIPRSVLGRTYFKILGPIFIVTIVWSDIRSMEPGDVSDRSLVIFCLIYLSDLEFKFWDL